MSERTSEWRVVINSRWTLEVVAPNAAAACAKAGEAFRQEHEGEEIAEIDALRTKSVETAPEPDSLGRQVAVLRRRQAMTQLELGARLGRSESWVSQVERGARDVDRLSVLTRLATALEVPTSDLLPDTVWPGEDMPDVDAYTEAEQFVAGAISTLPPFSRRHPAWALPIAQRALMALAEWEPADS